MSFISPLGFLALVAIAPLVAAYFLRRKQPPRTVSALFLWRTPYQRAEAGPRFERFTREVSLALECLAALFAALFLSGLQCGERAQHREMVVVLDGSLSMSAVNDGHTSAERAIRTLEALTDENRIDVLTIVESGLKPKLLAGPRAPVTAALSTLASWRPTAPSHELEPALAFAQELASAPDETIIHVITDGPSPIDSAKWSRASVHAIGLPADNVAFTSIQRRDEGGTAKVTVRLVAFSKTRQAVDVRFEDGNGHVESRPIELEPGVGAVLRASMAASGDIHVWLPDDALSLDSDVRVPAVPERSVRVAVLAGLRAEAQRVVQQALRSIPSVTLVQPNDAADFTIGPEQSSAQLRIGATAPWSSFVGPFFVQKRSELFDDVQLSGVVWTAGANPPGRMLAGAGAVALVTEDDEGAIHVNLELSKSNLQRSVAWPVLISNVLQSARRSKEGFDRTIIAMGESVSVATSNEGTWSIRSPSGQETRLLRHATLDVNWLATPGLWRLLKDGNEVDAVTVLALDAAESDLRTRATREGPKTEAPVLASLGAAQNDRAMWPLFALLAVVAADFWFTRRRAA